ncbi:MAG TPA: secondary thiamine-phosphate synthase enzyme YjbQ [Vicinamibacterales bacterium]|nr:secondary thiamine-phosphate synthase enzyme YjbQ [Vicinamibacterales bacterium]
MDTLTTAPICLHTRFTVETARPTEFVDLTDRVSDLVVQTGLRSGFVNVQTLHTTTAILVNEHEPLLLSDFEAFLDRLAPRDAAYRHDDDTVRTVNLTPGERHNGHAHCRALLLPSTATLNVVGGRLHLGRWQRLFFAELDGPRSRALSVMLLGEAWR